MRSAISDPFESVSLHVDALYRRDAVGRLLESNEASPTPAPRVFIARTTAGACCYFHADVPKALAYEIRNLVVALPSYPVRRGEIAAYAAVEEAIAAAGPIRSRWHGLAYEFGEPVAPRSSEIAQITDDRSALQGQFADFRIKLDKMGPFFAIIRDGAVVSACYSARTTADAAEAGVDTDPAHRGRGFAATVVNAWRAAIEDSGRTALYSTSYDNLSSQAVARRLGMRQYAETYSLT